MPFIKKGPAVADIIKAEKELVGGGVIDARPAPVRIHPLSSASKGRDFDAEARGKTRCALEEAWAQSPLLPMLLQDPSDKAALHALLDELVTERMKRVFPNG